MIQPKIIKEEQLKGWENDNSVSSNTEKDINEIMSYKL